RQRRCAERVRSTRSERRRRAGSGLRARLDGTYLFAASVDADPPNVMALDPATGGLLGVSPFVTSRRLSALDAVAAPLGEVCKAGTFRSMIDFDLDITTDQGTFSSSLSIPLGREAKTTAFRDDVEAGVNGWTAAGEWH